VIATRSRRLAAACLAVAGLLVACTPPGLSAPLSASTPASGSGSGVAPVGTLVIGVDSADPAGFNPHAIADSSPAEQAVANLVLPGVSTVDADGRTVLDQDLVASAEVTSQDPFTVTYTLQRNASWSDGTPITAEDFSYLAEQMVGSPGTVDPAGYRRVSTIRSRDAGKTVIVEFAGPVADWESMFSPLLPSHLLKDSPGGWAGALATGIPVSGNKYKMDGYDTTTGEITLLRNDKYWGQQPGPAQVVLRLGRSADLLAALQRGDLQAAVLRPDQDLTTQLRQQVPAARRVTVPMAATAELLPAVGAGATADLQVRQALAAALDVHGLGVEIGGSAAVTPVASLVGLSSTVAAPPVALDDAAAAGRLLDAAGWVRGAGVYRSRDGQPLQLTLGFPAGDESLAAAAQTVQSELGAVGIDVVLQRTDAATLLSTALPTGAVQLALLERPRGVSDALAADSAFGCPADASAAGGSAGSGSTPTAPAGNPGGFCDRTVQTLLDGAVASGLDTPTGQDLDARLWAALPAVPLGRTALVLAVAPELTGVVTGAGPGWAFTGPLNGLADWPAG
jgi:ABC-type transport system substrate-binding protein